MIGGVRRSPPAKRRALGQHHLADSELVRPVLDDLDIAARTVVEIGPGGGVLTRLLVEVARRVIAIELDPAWAFHLVHDPALRRTPGRLDLVVADAMKLDWSRLDAATRLAGNLPYSIATALIESLLDNAPPGLRACFMVQHEVALRLLAAPGSRDYGSFSVLFQARAKGRLLAKIRPGSFVPPPKVESALVGLELLGAMGGGAPTEPATRAEWMRFKATVRAGFSLRRKTLLNSLAGAWGRARARVVLEAWAGDAGRRAETLKLDEWLALHRAEVSTGCAQADRMPVPPKP